MPHNELPPGFVLDEPASANLPEGYVLDEPRTEAPDFLKRARGVAYDWTVRPFVEYGQVLKEGRTPEQAQAYEAQTPEQRALFKESGRGLTSLFLQSREELAPQAAAAMTPAIMATVGMKGPVGKGEVLHPRVRAPKPTQLDIVLGTKKVAEGIDTNVLARHELESVRTLAKTNALPKELATVGTPEEIVGALDAGQGPVYESLADYAAQKAGTFLDATTKPQFQQLQAGLRIANDIQAAVVPASRGPAAKQMAGIVRENAAELARKTEVAGVGLKKAAYLWESKPDPAKLEFIHAIETGAPQPNPNLQPLASTLRAALDGRRKSVQELGTGALEQFNEHYFPHIWKDPDQVRNVMASFASRRPLEGPAGFLKKRTIPTIQEGIALGFEPVSTNPITLTLLKMREMDRFVMGQKVFKEMKEGGLARFVKFGDRPPPEWVPIDDKIARVLQYDEASKGMVLRGHYYAPKQSGRVLHNYLSPGLRGNATYDLFRGLGNTLNMAQLGFSAFHWAFTALDSAVSSAALGLQKVVAGRPVSGLGNIVKAPIAPLTNLLQGSKILKEYLAPGTQGAELGSIVDTLVTAGGRAHMDRFYTNSAVEQFWTALRGGKYLTAGRKAFGAAVELAAKPTMEWFVPRVKMGMFANLAEFELSKLPPGSPKELTRAILGRAWDSVDNRMGQLVYDNLFWNRAAKDLGMASVRSLGWNIGTFREIGGGIGEYGKMAGKAVTGKWGEMELTPKMAYVAALPMIVGMYGGIIHYLSTGNPPEELKDYYFPKTGRIRKDGSEDRLSMASYIRDIYAYSRAPLSTLAHKANPVIGALHEMLANEDFYGGEIRNPDDPIVQQGLQLAKHWADQFVPFSVRGARQMSETGAEGAAPLLPFFGLTPAPAYVTRTTEAQEAADLRRRLPAIWKHLQREARGGPLDDILKSVRGED